MTRKQSVVVRSCSQLPDCSPSTEKLTQIGFICENSTSDNKIKLEPESMKFTRIDKPTSRFPINAENMILHSW